MHSTSPIHLINKYLLYLVNLCFIFVLIPPGLRKLELSQVVKKKQTVGNFTLSFFYFRPKENILFLEHTIFTLQFSRFSRRNFFRYFIAKMQFSNKYIGTVYVLQLGILSSYCSLFNTVGMSTIGFTLEIYSLVSEISCFANLTINM